MDFSQCIVHLVKKIKNYLCQITHLGKLTIDEHHPHVVRSWRLSSLEFDHDGLEDKEQNTKKCKKNPKHTQSANLIKPKHKTKQVLIIIKPKIVTLHYSDHKSTLHLKNYKN